MTLDPDPQPRRKPQIKPRAPMTRQQVAAGRFVQPADVAATMPLNYGTVLALIKSGAIPSTRVGRQFFIPAKWLLDAMDGNGK